MFRTLLLSATLSLAALSAAAEGQISLSINPRSADEAALVRLGLAAYLLHQDVEANGHVTQRGVNNAAGLYQQGTCNRGIIEQSGRDHTGTLSQLGCGNAHGLFQSGRGTTAHVTQTGGQVGLTFVHGF